MKRSGYSQMLQNMTLAVTLIGLLTVSVALAQAVPENQEAELRAQKSSPSFWGQQYLLGDWGGKRSRLAQEGLDFDFNNTGDFLTDVTGSQTHHATYFRALPGLRRY